jgi:sporulation and spore germination protein
VKRALALLGLLTLTGCASVPTHSPAHLVETVDQERDQVAVEVHPGPGASPSAIVSGYLLAQQSAQVNAASAYQFMTRDAQAKWRARDVIVADRIQLGLLQSDNRVRVTFHWYGTVDAKGSYRPATGKLDQTWLFRLVRNADGEWRIDSPPPGVLLPSDFFGKTYSPQTLFFLDPSLGRVVPDVRYLPINPEIAVRRLITLLGDGPSTWLDPVVFNAFNKVSVNQVDIDPVRHIAHIDVGGLNALVEADREGVVAQLVWTLGSLPSSQVYAVTVTSDGQPVDLRDTDAPLLTVTDLPSYDPDALPDLPLSARSDGQTPPAGNSPDDPRTAVQAFYVRNGAVYALGEPDPVVDGRYALSAVGVSTDLTRVAGVGPRSDGQGQTLWLGKIGEPTLLQSRLAASSLTRPTWDRATSSFWTVANGRFVKQITLDGRVRDIKLADGVLGPHASIGALRLAREGTRVAFTMGDPGARRLFVARVRSYDGSITLEDPIPVAPTLTDVRDVAWDQPTLLVALGHGVDQKTIAVRVNSDGSSVEPDKLAALDPAGATSITGAPDKPPVVASPGGTLSAHQGSWGNPDGKATVRGTAPAYPG